MSFVQIDDFDCPFCNKITMAELNTKTGRYRCFKCNKELKKGEKYNNQDDSFGGVF